MKIGVENFLYVETYRAVFVFPEIIGNFIYFFYKSCFFTETKLVNS